MKHEDKDHSRKISIKNLNHHNKWKWAIGEQGTLKCKEEVWQHIVLSLLASALSCYTCTTDSKYNDCIKNHVLKQCATDVGFDHCFTMKIFVKQNSGEEVAYLDKQCGVSFACNNPDPNYFCNAKNLSFIGQGHVMANCSSRCCNTDLCNNDDLPINPTTLPPIGNSTSMNATTSTPPPQNSTTNTPLGCGTDSVNTPLRMTIILAAVIQLVFKMMM